jgi:hypothetical protein
MKAFTLMVVLVGAVVVAAYLFPSSDLVRERVQVATLPEVTAKRNEALVSTPPRDELPIIDIEVVENSAPESQTPTAAERLARLGEKLAEEDYQSSGKRKVQGLIAAGLSLQDAETVVKQRSSSLVSCVLDIILSEAERQAIPRDEFLAALEAAVNKQEAWRVQTLNLDDAEERTEHCALLAEQQAGL